MRTYQRINAPDGVSAVGNMLIVGTAIIWVPLLVLYIGYQLLTKTLEVGDYSPKVVAAQKAKAEADKRAAYEKEIYVQRDANGKPIWTSTTSFPQAAANSFPVANQHKPKLTWSVQGGGVTYTLTDTECRSGWNVHRWDSYKFTSSAGGSGCYSIRNGVVGLGVAKERVVFFDVKDVVESHAAEKPKSKPALSAAEIQAAQIAASVKHAKEVAAIYSRKYASKEN